MALPHRDHRPAEPTKGRGSPPISFDVAIKLVLPEAEARRRRRRETTALMTVPEAAVHEDHRGESGQHEIRPTRQIATMQAEPVPESVDELTHRSLRCRVLAADAGHESIAVCLREDVPAACLRPVVP